MVEIIQRELFENGEVVGYEYRGRLVRCKDCIYQTECGFTEWLGRNGNGFCSSGERKEDETN